MIVVLIFLTLLSCTVSKSRNLVKIEYISPENNQASVSLKPSFVWRVENRDIKDLTFDLYLSQNLESVKSSQKGSLIASEIRDLSYSMKDELIPGKYFWKVVAHYDGDNIVEGPVWSFTTVFGNASNTVISPKILNTIFTEGGPFYSVFVLDDKNNIVTLTDDRLEIYNIDNDGNLKKISSFSKEGYRFVKMAVSNGFAYIFGYDITSNHCFCIADLSDISNPLFVSEITLSIAYDPKEVEVGNSYVYANFGEEIMVIDVGNPENPEIVKELKPSGLSISGDFFEHIKVYRNKLYITNYDGTFYDGILEFDVTNPASPKYIRKILGDQEVHYFELNKKYLFIVSYYNNHNIFAVYSMGKYEKLSEISLQIPYSEEIFIKSCDNQVFLVSYDYPNCKSKIFRIDISNPSSPVINGERVLPVYNCIKDIACSESFILIPDRWNGLVILENSDELKLVNTFWNKGRVTTSKVYKDLLIVSSGNGILIYDLKSSPISPEVQGHIFGVYSENTIIKDNFIYSIDGNFFIIDIDNPSEPKILGSLNAPGNYCTGLAIKDNYAYIANFNREILIVDVTLPIFPMVVKRIPLEGVMDLTLDGTSLYASVQGRDEIIEFDITDPSNPKTTRRKFLTSSPGKLLVAGDNIYVATNDWRSAAVISIDRKDFKERIILKIYTSNLKLFGDHLYILGDKIYVFDISSDELIYTIDAEVPNITDITFYKDYIYISTSSQGIVVIQNDFESRR